MGLPFYGVLTCPTDRTVLPIQVLEVNTAYGTIEYPRSIYFYDIAYNIFHWSTKIILPETIDDLLSKHLRRQKNRVF